MSVGTEAGASVRQGSRQKPAIYYKSDDGDLELRASKAVEKWGQSRSPSTLADDDLSRLPELALPGDGEQYDDCGEPLPTRFCKECGHVSWAGRTCGRSMCPRCWRAWDRDRTVSITAKLEGLRRLKEVQAGDRWTGLKFHHLQLSPDESFALRGERPLDRAFEIVKELGDEIGAETGVVIYHPYRIDPDAKADIYDDDDDGLTWAKLQALHDEGVDISQFLSHEPHFHVVCLSRYVTGGKMTKALQDKTGWNIKRITPHDSNVSIGDVYDLTRVVGYSLSHAGVETLDSGRKKVAYRYFGEVANFSATEGVKDDMRNAFAAISERILGVEFHGVATDIVESSADDDDGSEPEHRHRYLPFERVFRYYKSGPWRDQASHLQDIRLALNYLSAMRPRPALPPPSD